MAHLIDKSALIAEIERLKKEYYYDIHDEYDGFVRNAFDKVLSFLNTLEVKESLTWQDIKIISEIGEDFMNSSESDDLSEEDYYKEILRRFKTQKEKKVCGTYETFEEC